MKSLFSGLLLALFSALPVTAQDIPKYEGTYVRLDSGELIELNKEYHPEVIGIKLKTTVKKKGHYITWGQTNITEMRGGSPNIKANAASSSVNTSLFLNSTSSMQTQYIPHRGYKVKSIVLRSRSPELSFIGHLINKEAVVGELNKLANLTVEANDNWQINWKDILIENDWGNPGSQFRGQILDEYTTEYEISGDVFTNGYTANFTGAENRLKISGYGIRTGDNTYLIRFGS